MQRRDDPSHTQQRRSTLPALAPRSPESTSNRVRPASSTAPRRTPRLSHRSRDGCWTCRKRKVKCDEQQPTCGPCGRLSRECDWGVRWNFNDATSGTKARHTNVSTEGSVVWDPTARATSSDPESSTSVRNDDLPEFATLTNDGDRERKAITKRPGTYAVVVTPESFAELPEYSSSASTSTSMHASRRGSKATVTSADGQRHNSDPDTIVLDRFEDVAPGLAGPFSLEPLARRASLPKAMQNMTIMSVPPTPSFRTPTFTSPVRAEVSSAESRLIIHFRTYIMQRLQPEALGGQAMQQWGQDTGSNIYEQEAARFPPLHHAICAVSALNLSTRGQATLEEAIQHYQKALDSQSSASSNDMLLSDGVFLRHYLLFIYDICADSSADDDTAMWAKHLYSLRHLAQSRFQQCGRENHPYVLSSICALDVYAGLMGNGKCDFIRTMLDNNMMPPLGAGIESAALSPGGVNGYHEAQSWQTVLNLNRGILVHASNVAQAAHTYRAEAARQRRPASPGFAAHWQSVVGRLEHELIAFWSQAYPQFLPRDSPHAGQGLIPAMRLVFEHALLLYHACVLYLRTLLPPTHTTPENPQLRSDTAYRTSVIFTLASTFLQNQQLNRRDIVLPLFIAGLAATAAEDRIRALDFLAHFEGSGIGRNTSVAKQLLSVVFEEQRQAIARGESGWVDWVAVGRARGLGIVVCGL